MNIEGFNSVKLVPGGFTAEQIDSCSELAVVTLARIVKIFENDLSYTKHDTPQNPWQGNEVWGGYRQRNRAREATQFESP